MKSLVRLFPRGSSAPVVIVAVYRVPGVKAAAGVNVAVVPAYVTVPVIAAPPAPVTRNVDIFIVVAFIASLKLAVIICVIGTAVAPLIGVVAVTAGTRTILFVVPHAARRLVRRNARTQVIRTVPFCISFSYLHCARVFTPRFHQRFVEPASMKQMGCWRPEILAFAPTGCEFQRSLENYVSNSPFHNCSLEMTCMQNPGQRQFMIFVLKDAARWKASSLIQRQENSIRSSKSENTHIS